VIYKAPPVKQPKLIVAGSGTLLDLGGKTEVLIGREDPIAGIFPQIDMTAHGGQKSGVSRQHAKISKQGNQWMIEDLNSVNHTYVNKKRVTPDSPHPLNKGDEIRLGRAILRFELF
jgi:pSer/pThr/pTyr-binding forkhead associated (FHA) protein